MTAKMKNAGWVVLAAAALVPILVVGCQPKVSVQEAQLASDGTGRAPTAAAVALGDPAAAIPSEKPTIRPGEANNGNELWDSKCESCHGTVGAGDGKMAAEAAAKWGKLPDFTDMGYTRDRTPLSTYIAISGADEPHAFGDRSKPDTFLTDQQRWNLTYYVWSLHTSDAELKRGGATFNTNCSVCHGTRGRGDGFLHIPLNPQPRNFTDFAWMMNKPDNRLFRSIQHGRKWTAMPGWSVLPTGKPGLSRQEIYEVVDYLRSYTYTTEHDIIVDTKG